MEPMRQEADQTYVRHNTLNATAPMTWAVDDVLSFHVTYEAAASALIEMGMNNDHGALSGLSDNDHPLYLRLNDRVYYVLDATWTKADYPDLKGVFVRLVGAGGGGGGAVTTGGSTVAVGGGGGGGGYSEEFIAAADLGTTEAVVAGTGGAGGDGATGTVGETSSFGSHLSATGGSGGTASAAAAPLGTACGGGNGGDGSGGDLNLAGGEGLTGYTFITNRIHAGMGGSSMYAGNNGRGIAGGDHVGEPGDPGGGGGAGAGAVTNNAATIAGGVGGDGLVIVEVIY